MKPTDSSPEDNRTPRVGAVLDRSWEDSLRAGQEQDGGAGSVEGELAVLHLLRHARGPEPMPDGMLDEMWSELDGAITPTPWWRRRWVMWGAPIAAAAAVMFIVVRGPGDMTEKPGGEVVATVNQGDASAALSTAAILEQQFAQLEPGARRALNRRVDDDRGALRGQLLAMAMTTAEGAETIGENTGESR